MRLININDDYASLRTRDWYFYYGYEETDEWDNWLFVATRNGERYGDVMTASELGLLTNEEPGKVLLAGIGWLFDTFIDP